MSDTTPPALDYLYDVIECGTYDTVLGCLLGFAQHDEARPQPTGEKRLAFLRTQQSLALRLAALATEATEAFKKEMRDGATDL